MTPVGNDQRPSPRLSHLQPDGSTAGWYACEINIVVHARLTGTA